MKVRIGRVRENAKLVLHLEIAGATCDRRRSINAPVRTANAAARRCKLCFTDERIALAQRENNGGPNWDRALDALLAGDIKAGPLEQLPGYDAERDAIAAAWATAGADAATGLLTGRPLSALGLAAIHAGGTPVTVRPAAPKRTTKTGARKRLNLHRSFATKTAA